MTWSERSIARAIALQLLDRRCIVLVDNCNWTGHECDVLGVTTDLRVIDVEVKISRADLKADASKSKWFKHLGFDEARAKGIDVCTWDPWKHREPREWPTKVWKHYYALPAEIWKPELLEALPSTKSGVLLLSEGKDRGPSVIVKCERRATPNKDAHRLTPEQVVDVARLASLRMWNAYEEARSARADLNRLGELRGAAA